MGDIGEVFKDYKEIGKSKKRNNLYRSTLILDNSNVIYKSKNGGAHLIIPFEDTFIDFWPSTGKYINRSGGRPGRGIFNLLKVLGIESPSSDCK